jgi:hypothetical protein
LYLDATRIRACLHCPDDPLRWPVDVFYRVRGECEIVELERRAGRDVKREAADKRREAARQRLRFARKTGLLSWFRHG